MSEKHHQNICKWDLVLFPSSHRMQWCKRFQKRRSYNRDKSFFLKNTWTPLSLDNTPPLLSLQRRVARSHPARPVACYLHPLPPSTTRRALSSLFWIWVSDEARAEENRPVLDVGFAAAEAWGVHGERDRLEPGPLGPSHQLLHHLPVLVHLQRFMAHMQKDRHTRRNHNTLQSNTRSLIVIVWHPYI